MPEADPLGKSASIDAGPWAEIRRRRVTKKAHQMGDWRAFRIRQFHN